MEERIRARGLTPGYEGRAVSGPVDFVLRRGDWLAVLGENGAGKTTLLRTVLGLLPPVAGCLETPGLVPGQLGWLPQQTAVQRDMPASVWEVALSGRQGRRGWRPFYGREDRAAAARALEQVGMAGFVRRRFRELSGGQRQRVLLARALCAGDQLLLLDEPVTGLDSQAAAGMYRLLAQLNRQGTAIFMISHDLAGARQYASHVLYLGAQTSFFGTRAEYENWKGENAWA